MSFALDAAVGALRSRRTAPAKVTAKERLSEQRTFCKTRAILASRDAQAKVVAEASYMQNLCFEREPWFIKARIGDAAINLWLRP